MSQSRNFVFTWNNPPLEYHDCLDVFVDNLAPSYLICQLESGDNNTPHLQGYVEFGRGVRFSTLHSFDPNIHWEARRGTAVQARDYCRKEATRLEGPHEWGTFSAPQPGRRVDLEDAVAAIRDGGIEAVIDQFPTTFVKFHSGLHRYAAALQKPARDDAFVPRPWQQSLINTLSAEADDRHILWVHDSVGNKGKSRLAKFLLAEKNAIILTGKKADMAYAYDKQPIVIFDISRSEADNMAHLYSMAENLKNGHLFSSKYNSVMKTFKPPHVVFFANMKPAEGAWSADRLKLIDLDIELAASDAFRFA